MFNPTTSALPSITEIIEAENTYPFTLNPENDNRILLDIWHIIHEANTNPLISDKYLEVQLFQQRFNDIINAKMKYFNKNQFPNDLIGELKANVTFAQASIIPAKNRIAGDTHPTLVSDRNTLILVKPHKIIAESEPFQFKIFDKKNNLLITKELLPPSKLPPTANNHIPETDLLPRYFNKTNKFDLTINHNDDLKKVTENPIYFDKLIKINDKINIIFNDPSPQKTFVINNNTEYSYKYISIYNDSNKTVKIEYGNKHTSLKKNNSLIFICDGNGRWQTKKDVEISEYYRVTPSSFEFKLKGFTQLLAPRKEGRTDTNNLDQYFKIHSSIELELTDNDWVKKIYLINNKQHSGKKILFSSKTKKQTEISFNNNIVSLKKGEQRLLVCNFDGVWENTPIAAPPPLAISPSIIDGSLYDLLISDNSQIQKITNDSESFNQLIAHNETIKIATSDGNWAPKFRLNANDFFHNKKVMFSSEASYTSSIFYGSKKYELKTGEKITFIYDIKKKWVPITEPTTSAPLENLAYSENTWSAIIPKEYIKPGIRFEFNTLESTGALNDVKIGAPNILMINTIDIGMLTPPRNEFDFQNNHELNRQYGQTVPAATLIVTRFDPVYLTQVVTPRGELFIDKATGEGGGHDGNMRHEIAKDLISDGINSANYGINSSQASAPSFLPTFQVTMHNSVGVYENGIQHHGWSGGGGKATLYESKGNEVSHELGHNFGLGDYHGGPEGGTHTTPDKKNSSWLWDCEYNYFIPNLSHDGVFNTDAMSSGYPFDSNYNSFTAYTPNSLAAIQKRLQNSYIFSPESTTGYKKWDSEKAEMVDASPDLSELIFFHYSTKNGENLTDEKLNTFAEKYKFIHIQSGNGYHTPNMIFPPATPKNKGSIIKISSFADWSSNVIVNSVESKITKDKILSYISNGHTWQKIESQGIYKKPDKQGVPIITLTGFYDPDGKFERQSCIPLYGSFGMVYRPDEHIPPDSPYLEVILQDGTINKYQLHAFRMKEGLMNKYHVNIEWKLNPVKVNIYVNNKIVHTEDIEIKTLKHPTTINGEIV
ncbi:hypothetical protein M0I01_RS13455 [Providencia rettgeri]|nr:hypothetical protein [Providencia rettgeri]